MDDKRYVVTGKSPFVGDDKYPKHKRNYSYEEAETARDNLVSNGFTDVKIVPVEDDHT